MAFSDFWRSMAAVRDSQQQKGQYDLDMGARAGFGRAVQDPMLFNGPPGQPMGSPDQMAYGGQQDRLGSSVPRGIRNNNPGNLTDTPWTRSQPGYAGTDGRFARFNAPGAGANAVNALLSNYAAKGINTVGGIINTWAPPSDNNPTNAYVDFVSKAVGVDPNQPLSPEQRFAVGQAITRFENGQPKGGQQAPMTAPNPAMGGGGMQGGMAGGQDISRPPERRMMASGGVGPDPTRFGTDSPPVAEQGGAVAGASSAGAAPSPGGGAPPMQMAQAGGGIDMNRIVSAVQKANPNADPAVIGEVVKRFLPILQGERGQANTDRTFQAGREDESFQRADSNRRFAADETQREFNRSRPMPVQTGVDYVDPNDPSKVVVSGREKTGPGARKLDAGTMKAVRELDASTNAASDAIGIMEDILKPGQNGKSLNDLANYGLAAGTRGYIKSLSESSPKFKGDKTGTATTLLTKRIQGLVASNLKAAFGGNPTEGERKYLEGLQANVNEPPQVRKAILEEGMRLLRDRVERNKRDAEEMRGGTYYSPNGAGGQSGAPAGGTVIDGVRIERMQ